MHAGVLWSMTTMAYTGKTILFIIILCQTTEAQPMEIKSGDANFTTACRPLGMHVTVRVEPDFQGMIYTQGHADTKFCQFTSLSDSTRYANFFYYSETTCGERLRTTENKTREFSVTTIVQFSPDVLMGSDKSHKSTCTFYNNFTAGTLFYVNDSDTSLNQSQSSVVGDTSMFAELYVYRDFENGQFEILDGSTSVPVGTRITLGTTFHDSAIFSNWRVTNCMASNRVSDTDADYVSLRLLDENGCPASESLVDALQMKGPQYTRGVFDFTDIELNAFMFVRGRTGNSNQLVFTCDVLLCPDDNEDFCNINCSSKSSEDRQQSTTGPTGTTAPPIGTTAPPIGTTAPPIGTTASPIGTTFGTAGRKRRAAAEGTKMVTVGRAIKVVSLQQQEATDGSTARPSPADADQCLDSPKMQSIMVAMGVLLLALLMVVVTLVVLFCRRRRRDGGKQVDDGVSMGSSAQKLSPDHWAKQRG